MNVLIADDDPVSRKFLSSLLGQWGFTTTEVEDGAEVLNALDDVHPPQLLLLDWDMPGPSGIELCKYIARKKSLYPPYILLTTGKKEIEDIVTGLDSGANDYICKPYEALLLKARLNVARRTIELQEKLAVTMHKLELQANIDELTALPNRRATITSISKELHRASRLNTPLCIGMCDLDYFKKVNDTYGHECGDRVLETVALNMREQFRAYDVLGRVGGEEFLFAMNGSIEECKAMLERIRHNISELVIEYSDVHLQVTMSFGTIIVQNPKHYNSDIKNLIKLADMALYESKGAGRNRITYSYI